MSSKPDDVAPAALFVLAGPSCSGKDTLLQRLLEARPQLARPVTTTTRPPREHEEDGVHYHFVSEAEFRAGVEAGAFLENARVHDARYGLTRRELERIREQGQLPAAILDVQGVATVSEKLPVVSVFIDAPLEQLADRMRTYRPEDEVQARLASATRERACREDFDRVILNPDGELERAVGELLDYYRQTVRPRLAAYGRSGDREARPAGRRRR